MRLVRDGGRRWGALVGVVLAASALVSGYSLSWEYPSESSPTIPADQIARFVANNRGDLGVSLLFEGLTAIVLVVFVGLLCQLIADVKGSNGLLGRLFYGFAVLVAAVNLAVGLPTGIALVQFTPSSAAPAISTLWMLNFADMIAIGFPLSLLFGVSALAIWRTRVVARWIALVSVLAAALEGVAAFGTWVQSLQGAPQLPLFLTVWALLVGGGLMFERRRAPMPIEDLEAPPRGKKSHAFAASATC